MVNVSHLWMPGNIENYKYFGQFHIVRLIKDLPCHFLQEVPAFQLNEKTQRLNGCARQISEKNSLYLTIY